MVKNIINKVVDYHYAYFDTLKISILSTSSQYLSISPLSSLDISVWFVAELDVAWWAVAEVADPETIEMAELITEDATECTVSVSNLWLADAQP